MKPLLLPQAGCVLTGSNTRLACAHHSAPHNTPSSHAATPSWRREHTAMGHSLLPNMRAAHMRTALASTLSTERTPLFNSPTQPSTLSAKGSNTYSKGRIVRGTVEELHAGAATILLADGSTRAKLPFESITKRYIPVHSPQGMTPPLAVGEQILAMVRTEAQGREPTRLSTAALETMPGSILEDKQSVFAEAEEWLQAEEEEAGSSAASTSTTGRHSSYSAWRGARQLQRFIQPALEDGQAAAGRRRGLSSPYELRPGSLVRGIVASRTKNGLLVQLSARPYIFGLVPLKSISHRQVSQQELGSLFKPGSEIMVHVRRVQLPQPAHLASKQLVWLSTSDLELEEGSILRSLSDFNASARDVHAQQQLTQAAMAIREARTLMAQYRQLEEKRTSLLEVAEGTVVRGRVAKYLSPELLLVNIKGAKPMVLHSSQVAKGLTSDQLGRMAELMPVGSQVTAMVIGKQLRNGKTSVELSLRTLEQEPGQALADPEGFQRHAEAVLRQRQQQQQQQQQETNPSGTSGNSSGASTTATSPASDTATGSDDSGNPSSTTSPSTSNNSTSSTSNVSGSSEGATSDANANSSSSSSDSSKSSSHESTAPPPPPRLLRVPPPIAHMRVLASAAQLLDERVNLGVLVEATRESSNAGEYADIAHELGREYTKIADQIDTSVASAMLGDLPWSPSPPPLAPSSLISPSTASSSSSSGSSSNTVEGSQAENAQQQQQQQQQQQHGPFTQQFLAAPERDGALLSADSWKRASGVQCTMLVHDLGLRMKARALRAALAWQRLLDESAAGERQCKGFSPPTPHQGRALLQASAPEARTDALALGTAPSALPAPTALAHVFANAADSLALLHPGSQAPQQAQQGAGKGRGAAAAASKGGRPRLFPGAALRARPSQADLIAAAKAQGAGLAAEARNMWFAPSVPLLMDWAIGGRASGAEVLASGVLQQCFMRAGLLKALPSRAVSTASGPSTTPQPPPEFIVPGSPSQPNVPTPQAFYERLFSKLTKSMVPSAKVAASVAKQHANARLEQQQQQQELAQQSRRQRLRRQQELKQQQEAQANQVPSPPPEPLQGALVLLWMAEGVGAWEPSHDWWDAFLQRYAAVLPPGVSLFGGSAQQGTTHSGSSSDEDGAGTGNEDSGDEMDGAEEAGKARDLAMGSDGDESNGSGEGGTKVGRKREPWEVREARATAARLSRAL